ncbi:MAG: hypothetical protein WBG46_06550 [Nonlabens sp.]
MFILCIVITSCETNQIKEVDSDSEDNFQLSINSIDPYANDGKLGSTPEERMRKAILELTELSKIILLDQNVQGEMAQVISNTVYIDHVVSIEDLLNPQSSLVYQNTNVPDEGKFKAAFEDELQENISIYKPVVLVTPSMPDLVDGPSFFQVQFL